MGGDNDFAGMVGSNNEFYEPVIIFHFDNAAHINAATLPTTGRLPSVAPATWDQLSATSRRIVCNVRDTEDSFRAGQDGRNISQSLLAGRK